MYCSPQIKAYTPDGGETTGYEEVRLSLRLARRYGLADFDKVRLELCHATRRRSIRLEVRAHRRAIYERQRPSAGMVLRQGDRRTEGVECAHTQQPRRSCVSSWRGGEYPKLQHTVQRPAVESTTNSRAGLLNLVHDGTSRRTLCCARELGFCLTAPAWTCRVCTMLVHTPHYTTTFYDEVTITIYGLFRLRLQCKASIRPLTLPLLDFLSSKSIPSPRNLLPNSSVLTVKHSLDLPRAQMPA